MCQIYVVGVGTAPALSSSQNTIKKKLFVYPLIEWAFLIFDM
ncbi:TPA: hypothetical protein ACWM1T_001857 [Legionella pneumophila]